ncbi:venom allergen 5.02-like [Ostrinia nubilalis]|uniref:venom allergen 5.02-like n=1 Tax=Ostrinia nubilalis TaxID=29057 RepID=UPI0030824954
MNYTVWDAELANKAAGWVSQLRQLQHNPNREIASNRFKTGENIFWSSTTDSDSTLNIGDAIDSWFSEHKDYRFQPYKSSSPPVGHYTQMIWSDTTYVGCAMSRLQNGKFTEYYVVCNYGPPGNFRNEFPYEASGQGSQKLMCSVGKDKCNKLPYGDSVHDNRSTKFSIYLYRVFGKWVYEPTLAHVNMGI